MQVKGFQDTINWYNQNAETYAKSVVNLYPTKDLDEFAQLLKPGAKILDAGCGSGRDTNLFLQKGFNAQGLDISAGLIAVAKKTYPNLTFNEGTLIKLPFPEKNFDGVWANASLLHFEAVEEVKKALSEFSRVLKLDGILHVLVKAQTGKNKTAVVTDALSKHDRFFQYFTISEIKNLIKEAGFKILKAEQVKEIDRNPNGRPEVEWIRILAKNYEKI